MPIVFIQKAIIQIKSVIIDNIHNINFVMFNISTLVFFLIFPDEMGGVSYPRVRLIVI